MLCFNPPSDINKTLHLIGHHHRAVNLSKSPFFPTAMRKKHARLEKEKVFIHVSQAMRRVRVGEQNFRNTRTKLKRLPRESGLFAHYHSARESRAVGAAFISKFLKSPQRAV